MKRAFPALVVAAFLAGCGGGGGFRESSVQVEGTVELPPGSGLSLSTLRVQTSLGSVPVRADGHFVAREPSGGPAQVMLLDRAGHLLLLGYVDGDAPKAGKISAQETAVALLFDGLMPFMPPPAYWKNVLDLIRADPVVPPLAQTIATRVAANATALADGDAAIKTALTAALQALAAQGAGPTRARGATPSVRPAQDTPLCTLAISPSGIRSGLELLPTVGKNGSAEFVNHFRRHAAWHAYRTGYRDASGTDQPVTPWERVQGPPLAGISATTGTTGVIGTLIDLITGQIAWVPTTSPSFELPVNPPEAQRTYYTVFAVGPGATGPVDALLDQLDPSLTRIVPRERDKLNNSMEFQTAVDVIQEMVLPLAFSVIPAKNIFRDMGADQAQQAMFDVCQLVMQLVPGLAVEIGHRDIMEALNVTIKALAESAEVRHKVVDLMIKKGILRFATAASLESCVEAIGKKAGGVLILTDAITTLFDIGTVINDIRKSQMIEAWTVTANKAIITITPDPAFVNPGRGAALLCKGAADLEGVKVYAWSTLGRSGHLEDRLGHSGLSFESTSAGVTYMCNASASEDDTDVVTVSAYLRTAGGQRTLIGTAHGAIRVTSTTPGEWKLNPQDATISKLSSQGFAVSYTGTSLDLPEGATLEFSWDSTKSCGSLFSQDGTQEAPFVTPSMNAVYKSNTNTGSDTITVRIFRVSATGSRMQIGTGTATITVKEGVMVPAKIVIWGPVYWVAGGSSTIQAGVSVMNVFEGTSEQYRVLFHAPGYYRDGQADWVYPRISKYSCEYYHGGFNVYELTDNQRAVMFYGEQLFGGTSSPPETREQALARFNSLYPDWRNAANDPGIQAASQYVLEILDW